MVEKVEEFKSHLEVNTLADASVFIRGHVRLCKSRLTELLGLLVAIRAQCWNGELVRRNRASQIIASRCPLVIARNIRIVQIVPVSVIVTSSAKRCCGQNSERIARLVDTRTADSPPFC